MTFAFMSVNAQAQSTCQPTKACKKVCTKSTKATTQANTKTEATADLFKLTSTKEATAKKGKACCVKAKQGCCVSVCKKGTKASKTSVTTVSNKKTKEPVAALKPRSN